MQAMPRLASLLLLVLAMACDPEPPVRGTADAPYVGGFNTRDSSASLTVAGDEITWTQRIPAERDSVRCVGTPPSLPDAPRFRFRFRCTNAPGLYAGTERQVVLEFEERNWKLTNTIGGTVSVFTPQTGR